MSATGPQSTLIVRDCPLCQERPFPIEIMEVGAANRAGHYLDDGIAAVLILDPEPARTRERGASQPNPTNKDIPYDFDHASLPDLIEPCVPTAAKRAPMGLDWVLRNRPTKKSDPCRNPVPPFVLRASPRKRSSCWPTIFVNLPVADLARATAFETRPEGSGPSELNQQGHSS